MTEINQIFPLIEKKWLEWNEAEMPPVPMTDETFRAIVYIFAQAMMCKMFALTELEGMSEKTRLEFAESFGTKLREFVKTYADLDTLAMYE